MAKGLSLCLMVVLALASSSAALKCYFCSDCENESAYSGDCPPGTNHCAETKKDGKVLKSCAPDAICNLKDLHKQASDVMNNLKGLLGDDAPSEGMPPMGEQPEIECCDTDYCNAASIKMMNPALLLVLPLALYFLRC